MTGTNPSTTSLGSVLLDFSLFRLVLGLFIWIGQRTKKQLGGIMGIGRSKAKLYDEERPKTRFATLPVVRAPKPRSWRWWTS
jgi:cell division protease FtsH